MPSATFDESHRYNSLSTPSSNIEYLSFWEKNIVVILFNSFLLVWIIEVHPRQTSKSTTLPQETQVKILHLATVDHHWWTCFSSSDLGRNLWYCWAALVWESTGGNGLVSWRIIQEECDCQQVQFIQRGGIYILWKISDFDAAILRSRNIHLFLQNHNSLIQSSW